MGGWLKSQSSVIKALVTIGLSLRVTFVAAKVGNYPTVPSVGE